ncbi:MAG: amidase domain-containing protein [Clostridium sp.]|nr:amidase domain-containing protein [Clostridium sp.]
MNYRENTNNYSREKAVNYALTYAENPNSAFKYFDTYNTVGGNCTNFVSQCLLAGGAPMIFSGENQWWYKTSRSSISWSVASSLYWHLAKSYSKKSYGVKGEEMESVSDLDIGDVIFYVNSKNQIQHSAIITSYYNDYPLISQNTPDLSNIFYVKSWAVKMHFMKILVS